MKAFISYSHYDGSVLERLRVHLALLRRDELITEWYDRAILAGGDIDGDVEKNLEEAELFIAIVSPDFLASNYCYEREMERAIERVEAGTMRIVPVIAEPCEWTESPLGRYKALPRDGKAISEWTNQNNAFLDIATELRRIVLPDANRAAPVPSRVRSEAKSRYRLKRTFDQIDRSDFRVEAFAEIKRYFENAVAEIDAVEGVRARFRVLSQTSFSCTILNQFKERGAAHITMHSAANDRFGIGDISYSWSENAPGNSANGWLLVEADDYDLYLQLNAFSNMGDSQHVSPKRAAELLWAELLDQAGITHD